MEVQQHSSASLPDGGRSPRGRQLEIQITETTNEFNLHASRAVASTLKTRNGSYTATGRADAIRAECAVEQSRKGIESHRTTLRGAAMGELSRGPACILTAAHTPRVRAISYDDLSISDQCSNSFHKYRDVTT